VENCKYLGHILSSVSGDNPDMNCQMSLLYARTNAKFSKCSRYIKFCLFRGHCVKLALVCGTALMIHDAVIYRFIHHCFDTVGWASGITPGL